MNHFVTPQLFISKQAKQLGLELIHDFCIQRTARLAFFLDVNPTFDGHQAIFIWVEHHIQVNPHADLCDLHRAFTRCVPEY